jgi:anionic cell wall polymer biosynthesis LytR-Cps2A-Psr (LCP) family protein
VSFKKTKLQNSAGSRFLSVREAYELARLRNAFSGWFLGIAAVGVVAFLGAIVFVRVSDFEFRIPFPNLSIFPPSEDEALGGTSEKFNILLTGIGGGDHDGGNLTDTIILASVNRKSGTVSMLSLPRDLYVEYPTGGR